MVGKKRDPSGYSLGKEASAHVARRVAELLEERGLSQYRLAKQTDIPAPHLSTLLRPTDKGGRNFQGWQIAAIAKALGVRESDLVPPEVLAGRGEPEPKDLKQSKAGQQAERASSLPPGLREFLERHGDRIAPIVRRHLEGSHFQTDAGVVLDETFWLEQQQLWERRLGIRG